MAIAEAVRGQNDTPSIFWAHHLSRSSPTPRMRLTPSPDEIIPIVPFTHQTLLPAQHPAPTPVDTLSLHPTSRSSSAIADSANLLLHLLARCMHLALQEFNPSSYSVARFRTPPWERRASLVRRSRHPNTASELGLPSCQGSKGDEDWTVLRQSRLMSQAPYLERLRAARLSNECIEDR